MSGATMTSMKFAQSIKNVEIALSTANSPALDTTPLLLLHSSSERYLARRRIRSTASEITKAVDAVSELEAQLRELRVSLDAQKAKIMQSLSPISALPDELLSGIFGCLVDSTAQPYFQASASEAWLFSIHISHVCQRWRTVAIATRKLWTSITVKSLRSSRLIPIFAQRSGPLRLSVAFMPRPNERWTSTNASESVAPLDDSLIQDMIFGAQWSHPVFGDSTQPRASDAEPLNLLAIEYDVDIEELQRFSSARILRLKSSSLCSEEMSQLSMPRLEEIVLHHSPINEVSELLGSLRAPNLTHLQIIQGYGDPSAENALENTLELSLNVRFPLLQSLSIINTEHGSWPLIQHLTDLHDQSIPSRITHLDLTTYHWDDCEPAFRPLLHNLLSACPSLRSFSLGIHPWRFLETIPLLELEPGSAIPYHHLRAIRLEVVSDTFKGFRRPKTVDRSKFSTRTLRVFESRIGAQVGGPAVTTGMNTDAELLSLTLTRSLVGGNEAWYRSRVREFTVLEEERTLPY